jgi:hypothetical protein
MAVYTKYAEKKRKCPQNFCRNAVSKDTTYPDIHNGRGMT